MFWIEVVQKSERYVSAHDKDHRINVVKRCFERREFESLPDSPAFTAIRSIVLVVTFKTLFKAPYCVANCFPCTNAESVYSRH